MAFKGLFQLKSFRDSQSWCRKSPGSAKPLMGKDTWAAQEMTIRALTFHFCLSGLVNNSFSFLFLSLALNS